MLPAARKIFMRPAVKHFISIIMKTKVKTKRKKTKNPTSKQQQQEPLAARKRERRERQRHRQRQRRIQNAAADREAERETLTKRVSPPSHRATHLVMTATVYSCFLKYSFRRRVKTTFPSVKLIIYYNIFFCTKMRP